MKKYHIEQPYINYGNNTTIIYNDDENPIIKMITFKSSHDQGKLLRQHAIDFADGAETVEMDEEFHQVPGSGHTRLDCEGLVNEESMDNILEFLKIVQKIDPIPISAFIEVSKYVDFNFSIFINHENIENLFNKKEHASALKEALLASSKGDNEILILLANWYRENDDLENYLEVLQNFPKDHPGYIDANSEIYNQLMLKQPQDKEHQWKLLEKKFRSALILEVPEATNYFDELCGNDGLTPSISGIKGEPDTLIAIARQHKEMQNELKELRAYKNEHEKMKVPSISIFGKPNQKEHDLTIKKSSTLQDSVQTTVSSLNKLI